MSSLTETLKQPFLTVLHTPFLDSSLDGSYLGTLLIMKSLFQLDWELVTLTPLTKCLCPDSGDQRGPAPPTSGSVQKAVRAWVSPWGLHLISHSKSSQDPWSSSWDFVPTPLCSRIVPQNAPVWALCPHPPPYPSLIGLVLQGPAGDLTMRSSFSVNLTVKLQEKNSYLLVTQISPGRQRGCNQGSSPGWSHWFHSPKNTVEMGSQLTLILQRKRLWLRKAKSFTQCQTAEKWWNQDLIHGISHR